MLHALLSRQIPLYLIENQKVLRWREHEKSTEKWPEQKDSEQVYLEIALELDQDPDHVKAPDVQPLQEILDVLLPPETQEPVAQMIKVGIHL